MSRLSDLNEEPGEGPTEDPFDVAARQIAGAVSRQEQVSLTELETLESWCRIQLLEPKRKQSCQ